MQNSKIRFVVATRKNKEQFHQETLLGKCLQLYNGLFELDLYESNTKGLSEVYNNSIAKSKNDPAILIFAHDDIYLMDFWWSVRVRESLNMFDIVGVAGNQRRLPMQPTWSCADGLVVNGRPTIDTDYISGCVAIGNGNSLPIKLSNAGPAFREVKLLDGLILIVQSHKLHDNNLFLDERFSFHHYDMDFCRQAELKKLKMGTWGIPIIHESTGTADETWRLSIESYFKKWGS